jgi:uncharacterized protein YbbK (DUF523 family)/uncharacterized protein YbgA (DUF1722 family)
MPFDDNPLPLTLGLSSCLAGEKVRYAGDHRYEARVVEVLGQYAQFQSVCPEMAIGLGVPRKPIQLLQTDKGVRVRGIEDPAQDVTEALQDYAQQMASPLADVCGYIFKKGSPSCGVADVPIRDDDGNEVAQGEGMFVHELRKAMPFLPMVDERQLAQPASWDHFVEQVFALWHWRDFEQSRPDLKALQAYHRRYAHNLALRDTRIKYDLDAWLQEQDGEAALDLQTYFRQYMQCLAEPGDAFQRSLALSICLNELAPLLPQAIFASLQEQVQDFGQGQLALTQVMGSLRLLLQHHGLDLWQDSNWLFPHPWEQALRYPI